MLASTFMITFDRVTGRDENGGLERVADVPVSVIHSIGEDGQRLTSADVVGEITDQFLGSDLFDRNYSYIRDVVCQATYQTTYDPPWMRGG